MPVRRLQEQRNGTRFHRASKHVTKFNIDAAGPPNNPKRGAIGPRVIIIVVRAIDQTNLIIHSGPKHNRASIDI